MRKLRERDHQIAQERKAKVLGYQQKQRPRIEMIEKTVSKVNYAVKRDKDSLLAPTKAFTAQRVTGMHCMVYIIR